jgi:hypothetical protein
MSKKVRSESVRGARDVLAQGCAEEMTVSFRDNRRPHLLALRQTDADGWQSRDVAGRSILVTKQATLCCIEHERIEREQASGQRWHSQI